MRYRPWIGGITVALVIGTAVKIAFDVDLRLAGLCGLVWGITAWTAVGYPTEFSVSFRGLDGRDRWLAGMSLLLIACAFATIEVVSVPGRAELVLYAETLGLSIGLATLGALIETHN
ncbi:hypothetical protein ACERIT_06590 [Halopenitus sp. H-Gu1]|uniref:hypothetical protein n=1 Tax=Halopenitus sp. H-Gu1 TaxID=3242697 RepID=UPI00359E5737